MIDEKKGFIMYADQYDLFKMLSNEMAGELIKHVFSYINGENPETDNQIINIAFLPIKQQLNRDSKKWEKTKIARSKAGKASANRRLNKCKENPTSVGCVEQNPTKPNKKEQKGTNSTVNVNDTVTVNVKDKVTIKDINMRKTEFKNSLSIFLDDFDKEILNEFYTYWTEHGAKDRKMRFEKEKSFNTKLRLQRWLSNSKKFNKKHNNDEKFGRQTKSTVENNFKSFGGC